jgi:hypothetical protein
MKKITLSLFFLIQLFVFSAYAADPEDPYNKSYLLNPQDHLYTVNIDPLNPPNLLDDLAEALLKNSEGGVIVHWDRETDKPADITAEIPLDTQDPLDSLLSFLHSVKTIYGINDVTEDLELQSHSTNVERDRFGILPNVDLIILKQVCRFSGNQIIDVDGGRIIATLRTDTKRLVRLVSTFRPLECISPTNLLTESQIEYLHGSPNSEVILKLAPPRPELGHSTPLYIYQFIDRNDDFLEVNATNGDIIRTQGTTSGAFGLNRLVRQDNNSLRCEDSDISGSYNSSSQGSLCTDDYLIAYNSLYQAIRPMRGKHLLSDHYGENIGWGHRLRYDINFRYRAAETIDPDGFGIYNSYEIFLAKFVTTSTFTTLQTYNNQALPGLGAVIDLVGHEVGHGYLASNMERKYGYPRNTNVYLSPNGYPIGRAITEAFADGYGKIVEAEARYDYAGCINTYNGSCGNHTSISCGSTTCKRGEYCASSTCVACNEDCAANQTQIDLATMDLKFVHTYHQTGYPVLNNNAFFRNLAPDTNDSPISCSGSNTQLFYDNGLFLSRLILLYHHGADRLRQISGYIRHKADLSVGEEFFKQTLLNLRVTSIGPSRRYAEAAWLGTFGLAIKDTPSPLWNAGKWDSMTNKAVQIMFKMIFPVTGQCTSNCITNSVYECLRPQ